MVPKGTNKALSSFAYHIRDFEFVMAALQMFLDQFR